MSKNGRSHRGIEGAQAPETGEIKDVFDTAADSAVVALTVLDDLKRRLDSMNDDEAADAELALYLAAQDLQEAASSLVITRKFRALSNR